MKLIVRLSRALLWTSFGLGLVVLAADSGFADVVIGNFETPGLPADPGTSAPYPDGFHNQENAIFSVQAGQTYNRFGFNYTVPAAAATNGTGALLIQGFGGFWSAVREDGTDPTNANGGNLNPADVIANRYLYIDVTLPAGAVGYAQSNEIALTAPQSGGNSFQQQSLGKNPSAPGVDDTTGYDSIYDSAAKIPLQRAISGTTHDPGVPGSRGERDGTDTYATVTRTIAYDLDKFIGGNSLAGGHDTDIPTGMTFRNWLASRPDLTIVGLWVSGQASSVNGDQGLYIDNIRLSSHPFYYGGDMNGDGHFNAQDISAMQAAIANPAAYEASKNITPAMFLSMADFNGDGKVNGSDLQTMLNDLKSGFGNISTVPEPTSMALLSLGGVLVLARCRRRSTAS